MKQLFILGVGGTLRNQSSSEQLVRNGLKMAEQAGARVEMIAGPELVMPAYDPHNTERTPEAAHLVRRLAECDGLIIASPGYHGSVSGLVKNALDYIEDLVNDDRPYLDGRAVGCIGCGSAWQAAANTLFTLRSTVHALRGWPTPMGCAVNSAEPLFDQDGNFVNPRVSQNVEIMVGQVMEFATMRRAMLMRPRLAGTEPIEPLRRDAAAG